MVDGFGRFMKVLTFVAAAVALLLSFDYLRQVRSMKFEYPVLALLATAGMGMMISANDLISLYLGLELQSLALYVMAAIRRDDQRSSEAGLKYFVLGALVVRHAALRRLADLRLHRLHQLRRNCRRGRPAGRGREHRPHHRPGVPAGRHRLQGLGRAVPHVDARRLRGRAHAR